MDDNFEIPINYKGKEINLTAELVVFGYSHRILVWIDNQEIYFEPDEEKNYRAILDPSKPGTGKNPDIELLKIIARAIEDLLK